MSLTTILRKYPTPFRLVTCIGFPLLTALFWIAMMPEAHGADGSPTGGSQDVTAPLPILGTSITAGGAFWLLISFLQKTIDKMELKEANLVDRHQREIDSIIARYEEKLKEERQNTLHWSTKYQEAVNDTIKDARTNPRLPQGAKITYTPPS